MKIKSIYVILGIAALVIIGFSMHYFGLFVIGQDDLMSTGIRTEATITPGTDSVYGSFSNFTIVGSTNALSFFLAGQNKSYESGSIFFMMDDSPVIYNSFQDITEGTHIVRAYQMNIFNNEIQIVKWEKTYNLVINTVYINRTIANQTFYINDTVYVDRNVTVYQNQTIEKQVLVQPSITDFAKKYQIYIIGIAALALIYYLTRRKK